MTRILLSLFTIGVVMASATAATLAYFQNTATFSNDLSVLNTANDVNMVAQLALDNGTPTPFTATISPGETLNRCLWVRNNGGVPARFKVYMKPGSEVGSSTLGDALVINAKSALDASRCTSNPPTISGASTLYNNFPASPWIDVPVRGGSAPRFYTAADTPFLSNTASDSAAMQPNQFSVWQFDITLPSTVNSSIAGQSYTFQGEIFGVQDGGTL